MTINKKKRGRPFLEPGKAKENRLILRLTDQEKMALEIKASKKGQKLSTWARITLNQAP